MLAQKAGFSLLTTNIANALMAVDPGEFTAGNGYSETKIRLAGQG